MDACWGKKDGSTRFFYLALHTNFYRVGSPAPSRQVCFYKDVGFMGEHRCYGVGDSPTMDGGWNDAVSSPSRPVAYGAPRK